MDDIKDVLTFQLKETTIRNFLLGGHLASSKIHKLYIGKKITFNNQVIDYDKEITGNIEIDVFEENDIPLCNIEIDVIYENRDYLVINKTPNCIIHGADDALANRVAYYFNTKKINRIVRFPSRLDEMTSGIMIFPKHFLAASYLDYVFRENMNKKIYRALCYNKFNEKKGNISLRIGTDRHINGKMVVSASGKEAYTSYKVLRQNKVAELEIVLKTGRTHQIRVHLSSIKHPLLGDNLYGESDIKRVMLHAYKLEFWDYFQNKEISFIAPLPQDYLLIINKFFQE